MSAKNQILPIVVVLSLFVVCSMSAVAPWYREGATKTITLQQAKARPKFLACDALSRIKYQKRFKEKLGKIIKIRVYKEQKFFTMYERSKGTVEIQTFYRDRPSVNAYIMFINDQKVDFFPGDDNEEVNLTNFEEVTGRPTEFENQLDGTNFLNEDLLDSLSFQKCNKAVRAKYQKSYYLGKVVSINIEITNVLRFTITYQSSFAAGVKAIVNYEPKSGKVQIQKISRQNQGVSIHQGIAGLRDIAGLFGNVNSF